MPLKLKVMKVQVRVIPKASKVRVCSFNQGLKVYLNSLAAEGRANKELIEVLSDYYNTKKYNISIIKGGKKRDKVVEIDGVEKNPFLSKTSPK